MKKVLVTILLPTIFLLSRVAAPLSVQAQGQAAKPATAPHPPAPDAAARRQIAALLVQFRGDPSNAELRGQIIDLAKTLKPAPLIPLVARTKFAKAITQLKTAATADDFKATAALFDAVAEQAPWFADAYLNEASAYFKAGDLDAAERNLALYMSAVRTGADTTAAESLQHEIDRQQTHQRFQKALDDYQKNPTNEVREALVKLAQQMQPPPEIPEEAKQHYAQGKSLAESASNLENVRKAIAEFSSALQIAPWWPDPAQELVAAQATERQLVAAQEANERQLAILAAVGQLRNLTRYSDADQSARQKIIQAVRALPEPPPTPDDAVRFMARGEALVKMGGAGSYASAASEMEKAVLAAPWLADGYYDLGIVEESAEMYKESILNLRLYLLAAPQAANARAVQTKIYELEVMQEDQEKTKALAGAWKTPGGWIFNVTVDGNKIRITHSYPSWVNHFIVSYAFDLTKKGMTLEGTVTDSEETNVGCIVPSQTVPVTGVIGEGFRSMTLKFRDTNYYIQWNRGGLLGNDSCASVSSGGESGYVFQLAR